MRKKFLAIVTLLAIAICTLCAGLSVSAAGETPELGTSDPAANFNAGLWGPAANMGIERTGLHTLAFNYIPGYGTRGTFNHKVDLSDFSFSVDVSGMTPNTTLLLMFANSAGGYVGGNGAEFSIEIMASNTIPGNYQVIVGDSKQHNVAYPELITSNDNTYQGIPVAPEDKIVDFAMRLDGENLIFTIEGQEYTMAYSALTATLADPTDCYLMLGGMNGTAPQTVYFENLMDKNMKAYYAAGGAYETLVAQIEAYTQTANGDLSTTDAIKNAIDLNRALDRNGLLYGDYYLYQEALSAADQKFNAAVTSLGDDIIAIYEEDVAAYETAVEALETVAQIDAALSARNIAYEGISILEAMDTLTEEGVAAVAALKERASAADGLFGPAAKSYLDGQVAAFGTAASAVNDVESYLAARQTKREIRTDLFAVLAQEDAEAVQAAIDEHQQILEAFRTSDLSENWSIGNYYLFEQESSLGMYGNGVMAYTKEKVDVTNFEITLNFADLDAGSASWYSVGIMEKPEQFLVVDNASVQENKGLFFLLVPQTNKIQVETYLITITSGRFFDGKLLEILEVPYTVGQDLTIRLFSYEKTLAGNTTEYMSVSLNDVRLETTMTVPQIKTALGIDEEGNPLPAAVATQGYLVLCTNGSYGLTVKSINEGNPVEELKTTANELAFRTVRSAIDALPNASELTAENKDEVKADIATIKADYAALGDFEKSLVDNYSRISELENKIAQLERPVTPPDDGNDNNDGCGSCGGSSAAMGLLILFGAAFGITKKFLH